MHSRNGLRFALAVACALAVAGCSRTGASSGSLVGGFADNQTEQGGRTATALLNAMAGGIVGGLSEANLDETDRVNALEAEYRALEYGTTGEPVRWRNPSSGHHGEVVAAQPYRVGSQDCRQYSHTVDIGGQQQTARGTACRNSDGSWTPLT